MTTEIELLSSDTQSSIEALWVSLADDPQQRALTVARLCLDHAPHLIAWANNKIHNSMSDTLLKTLLFATPGPVQDGRLLALNALSEYKAGSIPERPAAAIPKPVMPKPRRKQQLSAERAAVSIYENLFGIQPQIMPVLETETLRVDWEAGRIAIALNEAAGFRFWVIGRAITRSGNGSGVVSVEALWNQLRAYRIVYSKRHFNRLLHDGEGLFWRRTGQQLYLRGSQAVAGSMTVMAREQGVPLDRNLPGVRDVYIEPSGPLEQWEGNLYAGWFAGRSALGGWDVTIARVTLSQLFGRHKTTLRRWEKNRLKHLLTIQPNVAQYVDDVEEATEIIELPAHAQPYLARIHTPAGVIQEERITWQIPNTYHADIRRHAHNGQAKKVRKAALRTFDPADIQSGGQVRLYYQSPKKLKARSRSRKFRMGLLGDVNRRVYVYLGQHRRSRHGVFEYTHHGAPITQPNEREQPEVEAAYFTKQAPATARFWQQRRSGLMA